jgi:methionyl-tRNA synthetase
MDRTEPWRHAKTDRERAATALHVALNAAAACAVVARPVIPTSAAVVLAALNLPEDMPWPDHLDTDLLPDGHPFTVPELLFRKIADEEVTDWTARFAGVGVDAESS